MTKHIFFVSVLLVLIAAAGYFAFDTTEESSSPVVVKQVSYSWDFAQSALDSNGVPHTTITMTYMSKVYPVGTYIGTCHELLASEVGILNDKPDMNEVARVQCWFAGSGDEIGVFKENGKSSIKAGQLGEGEEGGASFRGNFKTLLEV